MQNCRHGCTMCPIALTIMSWCLQILHICTNQSRNSRNIGPVKWRGVPWYGICMEKQLMGLQMPRLIRKSKDFVYGIWVYKALDIWKGYYRVKKSLVSYMKPWTEARNNKYMKYHSKLTYQLSFWNVSRKVDYHAGGKWFIHGPKRRKENQLLSLKHPCWLSLV